MTILPTPAADAGQHTVQVDVDEGLVTIARGDQAVAVPFDQLRDLRDAIGDAITRHDLPRLTRDHKARHGGVYGRPVR